MTTNMLGENLTFVVKDARMLKYILDQISFIDWNYSNIMKIEVKEASNSLVWDLLYLRSLIDDFLEVKEK